MKEINGLITTNETLAVIKFSQLKKAQGQMELEEFCQTFKEQYSTNYAVKQKTKEEIQIIFMKPTLPDTNQNKSQQEQANIEQYSW